MWNDGFFSLTLSSGKKSISQATCDLYWQLPREIAFDFSGYVINEKKKPRGIHFLGIFGLVIAAVLIAVFGFHIVQKKKHFR